MKPFEIVYIYEKPGSSSYYLVGTSDKKPLGFVNKADIVEWDNRLCLLFTPLKGRNPALVFDGVDGLEKCVSGAEDFIDTNGKPHPSSIAMEPDEKRFTSQRFSMLLPILGKQRLGSSNPSGARVQAYNIGFLTGGDMSAKVPPKGTGTISSSGSLAQLEVMFLIDATGSMGPYIEATKEIVNRVTQKILGSREAGCRFGVTAYRDYKDEYVYRQFSSLNRSPSAVKSSLSSIAAGGGHDAPEAVFDGFYGALTETNWHKVDNTFRIIVLIGDASPHLTGEGNPKRLTARELSMKASEKKVRTIAVRIKSGSADARGDAEFNKLAEGLTDADKGSYIEVTHGGSSESDFIKQTSGKIFNEIIRLEKMIAVIKESEGSFGTTPVIPRGTSSTDRAIILKNITIKPGSPRPIEFSTGWVSEYDDKGERLVNAYAYMTKNEFQLMTSYIKLMSTILNNPGEGMEKAFIEMIETSTGETLKEKDLEDHYRKALSLPVKTDILRIPIDEIRDWGEDRKAKMMKVVNGKINSLELWANNLDNWFDSPGGGSFEYTFVPVDMLP